MSKKALQAELAAQSLTNAKNGVGQTFAVLVNGELTTVVVYLNQTCNDILKYLDMPQVRNNEQMTLDLNARHKKLMDIIDILEEQSIDNYSPNTIQATA
jgi:hypothetical protein